MHPIALLLLACVTTTVVGGVPEVVGANSRAAAPNPAAPVAAATTRRSRASSAYGNDGLATGGIMNQKGSGVWTALPAAVQKVYTEAGVPHTNKNGRLLREYDPANSFLPLTIYDPQLDCTSPEAQNIMGQVSDRLGQKCLPVGYDASLYSRANFTAALPYPAFSLESYADSFGKHGLQVIREHPTMDEVAKFAKHPALLGWYLYEEPTGRYWTLGQPSDNQTKMVSAFDAYKAQYAAIKQIDPDHPVFILDCPWFFSDGKGNDPLLWWTKWNSYGDV